MGGQRERERKSLRTNWNAYGVPVASVERMLLGATALPANLFAFPYHPFCWTVKLNGPGAQPSPLERIEQPTELVGEVEIELPLSGIAQSQLPMLTFQEK